MVTTPSVSIEIAGMTLKLINVWSPSEDLVFTNGSPSTKEVTIKAQLKEGSTQCSCNAIVTYDMGNGYSFAVLWYAPTVVDNEDESPEVSLPETGDCRLNVFVYEGVVQASTELYEDLYNNKDPIVGGDGNWHEKDLSNGCQVDACIKAGKDGRVTMVKIYSIEEDV